MNPQTIATHSTPEELARATSAWLCDRALAAKGPRFAVCLSGGSTPKRVYELLATQKCARLPWQRTHWFFGDERFVPHDHLESNYRMVRQAMFDVASVPPANVHPMPTNGTPSAAAARYAEQLRDFYGAAALESGRPLFDVVLLGLGEDGHTASLFPGRPAVAEQTRWVVDTLSPKNEPRLTLTYPVLGSARASVFLVAGAAKRDIISRVWAGEDLPATRLAGSAHWFVDAAADPRA